MNYSQTIAKIRERGQLTIPQSVRQALNWPQDEVLVKIITTQHGFKVERLPLSHPQNEKKKLTKKEWDRIYEDMTAFSKTGRQDIQLTEFVRKDRDTHL